MPRPGASTCQPRRHRRPQAKKSCTSWADDWKEQVGCTVRKEQESRSQGFQHTPRSTNKRRRSITVCLHSYLPHCKSTAPTCPGSAPAEQWRQAARINSPTSAQPAEPGGGQRRRDRRRGSGAPRWTPASEDRQKGPKSMQRGQS